MRRSARIGRSIGTIRLVFGFEAMPLTTISAVDAMHPPTQEPTG
jgi:hypothetical protein